MLETADREFLLAIVSTPRRAHNQEAHQIASRLLGLDLLEILETSGTLAQRELALRIAAAPPLLSGECLACAFSAGKVLLREVEMIQSQNPMKPAAQKRAG